jgi:hypothetical protein
MLPLGKTDVARHLLIQYKLTLVVSPYRVIGLGNYRARSVAHGQYSSSRYSSNIHEVQGSARGPWPVRPMTLVTYINYFLYAPNVPQFFVCAFSEEFQLLGVIANS